MVTIKEVQANGLLTEQFINENMALVNTCIKKMRLPYLDDYFQEGAIGLLKATRSYKSEYGTAFSTYAVPMIIGEISRHRRDYESENLTGVHVSRGIKDLFFRSIRLEHKSDNEICVELGITQGELDQARLSMKPVLYLDTPVENDGGDKEISHKDNLLSKESDYEDDICNNIIIEQLFGVLDEKQAEILHMHLNLNMSQMEISESVGLSRAQVSRILNKILTIGKRMVEGGMKMYPKITETQLIEECRVLGTSKEAFEIIAKKYCMTVGSILNCYYRRGIKQKLSQGGQKNVVKQPKEENKPAAPAKTDIQPPEQRKILLDTGWKGKECSYTLEDGRIKITKGDGLLAIEDIKTMILELQELAEKVAV